MYFKSHVGGFVLISAPVNTSLRGHRVSEYRNQNDHDTSVIRENRNIIVIYSQYCTVTIFIHVRG